MSFAGTPDLPPAVEGPPPKPPRLFNIGHQKLGIDLDFSTRTLKGWTDIEILPTDAGLKTITLNCRQCTITRVSVNGKGPSIKHYEPYAHLKMPKHSTVHQHHQKRQKLEPCLDDPLEGDLTITLPKNVKVDLQDPFSVAAGNAINFRGASVHLKQESPAPGTPTPAQTARLDGSPAYVPITVHIEYVMTDFLEGLHFVGSDDDLRYPHAYTLNDVLPGSACSLLPTIDSLWQRHTWEISITCPRTLGNIRAPPPSPPKAARDMTPSDIYQRYDPRRTDSDFVFEYHGEDEELEMVATCSGRYISDNIDEKDPTKKVTHFVIDRATSPSHVAFAIGPFEKIDLTAFREAESVELMGRNAVDMFAFCLPGRDEQVRNTCVFMHMAVDYFVKEFGAYPYDSFSLCFVDDFAHSAVPSACLAICSNRLLFPEDQIDPIYPTTKTLTWALASQWSGVSIVPKEWHDLWVVIGIAYYVTGLFLKKLMGNNEYRFRLKVDADRLCELDVGRKGLLWHSWELPLSPTDFEFISLKAPMILYILDRRLTKSSGSLGLARVIPRLFSRAYAENQENELGKGELSTVNFRRTCEKIGHTKLEPFFTQWVERAGYPRFEVSQRFNKKKLIVEMIIKQLQVADGVVRKVRPETFVHEAEEYKLNLAFNDDAQIFTGPMTIRLHEADGTPYEHVVEIKETITRLDIPYMTKYKRIKRTKLHKERQAVTAGMDISLDGPAEDVLLYCLGDVLQSEEHIRDWHLTDWSKEEEDRMAQEAFEWIRVDADFEWICKLTINQPDHMFLSQLQQDRDVVAQYESIKHFSGIKGSPVISSILLRTLMDRRYYYGIRAEAANALISSATEDLDWIGRYHLQKAFAEFYCLPDSALPKANDFQDFTSYFVQCAIVEALGNIRERSGLSPIHIQNFLLDLLRYNDNSNNAFSDSHYVSILVKALGSSMCAGNVNDYGMDLDFEEDERGDTRTAIISEIERIQRMDKFMPSYQNTITHAALEVKRDLSVSKLVTVDLREFVEYLKEDTCQPLRLKAYRCLVALGGIRDPMIMKIMCDVIAHDPSPFMRKNVALVFIAGLGSVALGNNNKPKVENGRDEMIIEEDAVVRRLEDPTQDIAFALATFQKELSEDPSLKVNMWGAINSNKLGIVETRNLLSVCKLLYEEKTSLIVVLKQRKERRLIGKRSEGGKCMFSFIWDPTYEQIMRFVPRIPAPPTPAPTPPAADRKVNLVIKPLSGPSTKKKKNETPPPAPVSSLKVKKEKPAKKPRLSTKSASPAPPPPPLPVSAVAAGSTAPPEHPKIKLKFRALTNGIPSPDDGI